MRPVGLAEGIAAEGGKFADRVNAITRGRGVDVVVDLVGGPYVAESLACTATMGRIVVVGMLGGTRADLDLGMLMRRRAEIRGTMLRSRPLEEKIDAANVLAKNLAPLLASRALEPVVDRVLPLARAAEAHAYVASNDGFGKMVLEVD